MNASAAILESAAMGMSRPLLKLGGGSGDILRDVLQPFRTFLTRKKSKARAATDEFSLAGTGVHDGPEYARS